MKKHAIKSYNTPLAALEAQLSGLLELRAQLLREVNRKNVWQVEDAIKKCKYEITEKKIQALAPET